MSEDRIDRLRAAVENPGRSPGTHYRAVHNLRNEWPVLWHAIMGLLYPEHENLDNPAYYPTGEFDAQVWAEEFVKVAYIATAMPNSVDSMRGWFRNAIMTGYDQAKADMGEAPPIDPVVKAQEREWQEKLEGVITNAVGFALYSEDDDEEIINVGPEELAIIEPVAERVTQHVLSYIKGHELPRDKP